MHRKRFYYFFLIITTIIAGLASRHYSSVLPMWTQLYLGDVIWALMVFWGVGLIFRSKSTLWVAYVAIIFSFGIEISQLYHAVWIDAIRSTRIGGLILGFGFLWSDMLCYLAGISVGILLEKYVLPRKYRI